MKFKRIAAISALTLMLATGAANAKTPEVSSVESKIDASSSSKVVPVDVVNNNSPDVKLTEVGKQVAPGVIEVNPDAIKGKNLVFDQGDSNQQRIHICIGKWKEGSCTGIYIGSRSQT